MNRFPRRPFFPPDKDFPFPRVPYPLYPDPDAPIYPNPSTVLPVVYPTFYDSKLLDEYRSLVSQLTSQLNRLIFELNQKDEKIRELNKRINDFSTSRDELCNTMKEIDADGKEASQLMKLVSDIHAQIVKDESQKTTHLSRISEPELLIEPQNLV